MYSRLRNHGCYSQYIYIDYTYERVESWARYLDYVICVLRRHIRGIGAAADSEKGNE
jgi:hypothetical protein